MIRNTLLALIFLSTSVFAADYSDDIHKNDNKWMQFNLMGAFNELPAFPGESTPAEGSNHDYLEMEFGGRSGLFDLYGYVDVFNLTSEKSSQKYGAPKMFMKFAPRLSLDALTGVDMSFGPVQELYIATVAEWDGMTDEDPFSVNKQKIGVGSDIILPWFGKVGFNLYGTYDSNRSDWNGYQVSTNWFKPFVFFDGGSFISYQGYIDYQFGMKKEYSTASAGGVMFNGIYWHSDDFAVGYGLKIFKDVYGIKDGDGVESTGLGHYISVTYKF